MEEYEAREEGFNEFTGVDLQEMEGRDPQRARFIKSYLKKALI